MTTKPKHRYKERPYRVWDDQTQKNVPRRLYAEERNAHTGALKIAHWDLKVGQSVTVYNLRNGRDLGTYKRTLTSIQTPDRAERFREKE